MKESNVITPAFFEELNNKFPVRYEPGQPPIDVSSSNSLVPLNSNRISNEKSGVHNHQSTQQSIAPPPAYQGGNSGEMAEAMYNYQPNGPTDLALYPGMRVQILEKLNNDWWRGKDANSQQEGVFPANYVRLIETPSQHSRDNPATNNNYYPPPQQQQYSGNNNYYPPQQQQQFPPPSTNYYTPPPQQVQVQQQPVQAVAQPQSHSAVSDGAKKFGSKLGNAAIFGAGASIGSNIVNSIF